MNDEFDVLQAIYCRPNELLYDSRTDTITYNAWNEQHDTIGFSVVVYANHSTIVNSQQLDSNEIKQLRAQAYVQTTIYDMFIDLKTVYDELIRQRKTTTCPIDDCPSMALFKIDHMRSPTIYMKHLRQWTNDCAITGRVFVIARDIFLLIEGNQSNVKVRQQTRITIIHSI
jgi:hypothetical protein